VQVSRAAADQSTLRSRAFHSTPFRWSQALSSSARKAGASSP